MNDERKICPDCGEAMPSGAPHGLCPKCLLTPAVASDGGLDSGKLEAKTVVLNSGGSRALRAKARIRHFGDYELIDEIAHGGMGIVYKARQVSLNRTVAVKMILSGQFATESEADRFQSEAEAEAAASLRHPNIVGIHEVGEHEGQRYFSMEYVEGVDLSLRAEDGPLSAADAARCVKTIAEAIHCAHERGILHRDVLGGGSALIGILMLMLLIRSWVWAGTNYLFALELLGVVCIAWLVWEGMFMAWEALGAHETSMFGHAVDQRVRRQLDGQDRQWPLWQLLALPASLWVAFAFVSHFGIQGLTKPANNLVAAVLCGVASRTPISMGEWGRRGGLCRQNLLLPVHQ